MNTYLRRKLFEITFNRKSSEKYISATSIIAPLSAVKANSGEGNIVKNANCIAPVVSATPYLRHIAPGITGAPIPPTITAAHTLISPSTTMAAANSLSAVLRAKSLIAPGWLAKTVSSALGVSEADIETGQGITPNIAHFSAMIHQSSAIPASGQVMYPPSIISALQDSKIIGAGGVTAITQGSQSAPVAAIKGDMAKGAVCSNATTAAPLTIIKPIRARGSPYAGNCELAIPTLAELKPKIAAVENAEIAADKTTTALAELKSDIANADNTAEVATDKTTTALAEVKSSYASIVESATAKATIPAISTVLSKVGSSVDADSVSCVVSMENVKATKGRGGISRGANSLLGFCYASMTTRVEEDPKPIDFDTDVVSNLDTYFVSDIDVMPITT